MYELLKQVNSPSDLKKLSNKELTEYAQEVRQYILEIVKTQGGHLSPNLGTVELTIALHRVFDCPKDKILFDVGHQAYTHKIITGRREGFAALRTDDGVSGFPNTAESEYDAFTMGHSSTSLSVGLGYARARDILKEDYSVVSVIGDGAFTGGEAFEALNDIGAHRERVIIILNDNKMSISKNVGAFSEYLAKLRLSKRYSTVKYNLKKAISGLPFFANKMISALDKAKDGIKLSLLPDKIFESLGIKYYGPFDGHDIGGMVSALKRLKDDNHPVLLHVLTDKGHGVDEVMEHPDKYHGIGPTTEGALKQTSYASVVNEKLCEIAQKDNRVVGVTAAMAMGTGMSMLAAHYPERYFDVGIAEGHAVSLCAGMAKAGLKPFFGVYSSFLQRGFDQVVHDVCIDGHGVTFLIDHAGIVGGDGVTHQGVFDISYLTCIPNMTVMQPKDGVELKMMMDLATEFNSPLAIRYPKSFVRDYQTHSPLDGLKWEQISASREHVYVLAAGNRMLDICDGVDANVINARVIKPLDCEMLGNIPDNSLVITMEDGVLRGGFGESVRAYFANKPSVAVKTFGYSDQFLTSLHEQTMLEQNGVTYDAVCAAISEWKRKNHE